MRVFRPSANSARCSVRAEWVISSTARSIATAAAILECQTTGMRFADSPADGQRPGDSGPLPKRASLPRVRCEQTGFQSFRMRRFPMATLTKKHNSVVAVYPSHVQAEDAVKELQKSGYKMKQLSIVGRDFHTEDHVVGYYNAGDRMKYWGKMGGFWGGLWGVLFGAAFFWVPGIGPLLVAGPFAAAIVGGLEGALAVGGLSALGAGLYSIGIPRNSILKYETAIGAGKFLLIAHGTDEDVERAKTIIEGTEAETVDHHVEPNG
jgi:Heat induced stress protein YflT domain